MSEPATIDDETHDHGPGTPADLYVYAGKVSNLLVRGDGHGYAEMTDGTARFVRLVSTVHDPDTGGHALLVTEGNLVP